MKHITKHFLALCLFATCIISTVQAQMPQAINYQAALRNPDGSIMASTVVNIKFTIIHDDGTPQDYYIETHTTTTSAQGHINLKLGTGAPIGGTVYPIFSNIPWSQGSMLLKVEVQQGSAAFMDLGTQELVSVPYAFHAGNTQAIANVKVSTTAPTSGQVLKYNGYYWRPAEDVQGWALTGNSIAPSFFLGTTNSQPLRFKIANTKAGIIDFRNTAIGYYSLNSNTNGEYNSAFGSLSFITNTNGNYNSAFGYRSLYNSSLGNYNTAVGSHALYTHSNSSFSTAVGYLAGQGNYNNSTSIGSYAPTVNHNRIRLGNASTIGVGAQIGWTSYSDARIKTNVQANVPGLDFITRLRPVTYKFDIHTQNKITGANDDSDYPEKYDIEKIIQTGFIAQEVESAAKKIGYDFSGISLPSNNKDLYGLRYAEFVVPLVKAVQEQQEMIEELKAANKKLQERMDKMENK